MTKLEELTALLVNEINDFSKSIKKLEKINNELKATKIKMDLTNYKSIIEQHEQKMDSHIKAIERFESHLEKKIKRAKIYPTWAAAVFIMAVLFSVGAVLLAII